MKRLPDTELEVMKALWDSGPDTPRAALERALAPHGWAANTINTYLTRLADKGFLSARRLGRSNRYTPLVSREDYLSFDSRSVLSRLPPETSWLPWPGTGWPPARWTSSGPCWMSWKGAPNEPISP